MSDISELYKSNKTKRGKKKKVLMIALAFLGAILLVSAVIGVSFMVPKNITGTWELVVNPELAVATADEAAESDRAYYVFEKPDKYGRGEYSTCYQGGVEYFEYELLEENSVRKINLGTVDMEYKISGSKLLKNARLTIIYPEYTDESTGAFYEAQEYIFEQAKNPAYEKQSYKSFETDSDLTDEKWTSNERTLSYYYYEIPYTQTIEFTDGGVMIIRYESKDLALDRYMYYAYTAKENELTLSLVTDKETKYTVAYEFDENGNLKFADDTTADSMFADELFGEFTYYSRKNLPETSASADTNTALTE